MPATPPSYTSWGIGLDKSNAAAPKIVVFAHGAPAKASDAAEQRIDNDRWITRVLADTLAFDSRLQRRGTLHGRRGRRRLSRTTRAAASCSRTAPSSRAATRTSAQGLGNHVVLIRLQPSGAVNPAFGFGTTAPGIPGQTKFNPFVGVAASPRRTASLGSRRAAMSRRAMAPRTRTVPSKSVDLVSFGVKADGLDTTFGKLGAARDPERDGQGGGPRNDPLHGPRARRRGPRRRPHGSCRRL